MENVPTAFYIGYERVRRRLHLLHNAETTPQVLKKKNPRRE
jgi:hypothetical protein